MISRYNPEQNDYVKYIPIEKFKEVNEDLLELKERLEKTPVKIPFMIPNEPDDGIYINSLSDVKLLFEGDEPVNMDAPVNRRYASFLLVAAYFCKNIKIIKYLVEKGSSVHRVDAFGYNAIMSVILNENMEQKTKLEAISYLIDKGCDVNWLTCVGETALTLAISRMEIEIANLLLDRGAVLYKDE